MELLDEVTWPKPLQELLEHTYELYRQRHPWVGEDALSPKSVVRDMYERAMTFAEYVAFYGLTRSEGLVLRYLGDAFRALRQTVPERVRTDDLEDIIEWLGAVVRQTDSSLLDEWEQLSDPDRLAAESPRRTCCRRRPSGSPPTSARSLCWCATRCSAGWSSLRSNRWEQLGELEAETGSSIDGGGLARGARRLLRRARQHRHRPGRARPADAARREGRAHAGRCSRSSATRRATTTGASSRPSTSPPPTTRASWSST